MNHLMNLFLFDVISIKNDTIYKVNITLSDSQLKKLKLTAKNATGITLRISLNMIGIDETNFLHKLLLTDKQVSNICKSFENNSATIKNKNIYNSLIRRISL